ncbi:serine protease [Solirubrobacter ginsenosidimutans]|uniref:Serine protease n=1 Tax=Solirubrobacter ginsenosidimutans TaxID=490573 RepID=A0A9X3S0S0_9ACTN|nr:serine protease [Solirubrobacter ginsenosidimutans]MDA0160367.1 serine protease [Solirubrobacter ginsenosidimutans]
MRVKLILAVLLTAVAAAPAHAVSGGDTLPIAQAPYVAWLGGQCTGTLISPTRILTAAHCLDGADVADARVLVGVDGNTLTRGVSKLSVSVRGYTEHPKFKLSFPFAHKRPQDAIAVNDVGLILLKTPVRTIAPVRLAGADDGALEAGGAAAAILGYGIIAPETEMGTPRAPLQQGTLGVLGASDCEQAYPRAIQATMICTSDPAHQAPPFVMACPGDSGGPVIAQTPAGPVQLGITSWGAEVMEVGCGLRSLPNVAMRVSSYASFINQTDPVIQPYTTGGFRHTRIVGKARIGNTVTCTPPKLGGAPLKLSYEWSVGTNTGTFKPLRHAHGSKLKITKAIYNSARPTQYRSLFCTATARNAGGSLDTGLTSTRMRK